MPRKGNAKLVRLSGTVRGWRGQAGNTCRIVPRPGDFAGAPRGVTDQAPGFQVLLTLTRTHQSRMQA